MIIQNSYVVVVGNSFAIKDKLKEYGFKFDGTFKVWYKLASEKFFSVMSEDLNGNDEISVGFLDSLEKTPSLVQLHKEFKQLEAKPVAHKLVGAVLEMSKWYGKVFQENNNTKFQFRNFKVLNVYTETQKAYQVDIEFFGGIASSCGCCGLALSNAISIATGIGPICAEKIGMPRIKSVKDAQVIIDEMRKMSKAHGVFKQVWIPKSQIKNIIKE